MEITKNIKSFIIKCSRVWKVMRKPNSTEYKITLKVSALGLLLIGFIGFIISITMHLFFK